MTKKTLVQHQEFGGHLSATQIAGDEDYQHCSIRSSSCEHLHRFPCQHCSIKAGQRIKTGSRSRKVVLLPKHSSRINVILNRKDQLGNVRTSDLFALLSRPMPKANSIMKRAIKPRRTFGFVMR